MRSQEISDRWWLCWSLWFDWSLQSKMALFFHQLRCSIPCNSWDMYYINRWAPPNELSINIIKIVEQSQFWPWIFDGSSKVTRACRWKSSSLGGLLRLFFSGHVTMWRWKSWQWWVCLAFLDGCKQKLENDWILKGRRFKVSPGFLGQREEWKSEVWLWIPLSVWTWTQQASHGDAARICFGIISIKTWLHQSFFG